MPGRKDKKKDRGEKPKGGGGLASFLGVGGMPEFNDEDLEAELLAMTGGGVSKGKKKGSSSGGGGASLADIDKMLSSAHKLGEETGEGDDDEDDDMDVDDADLLAELEGMEDDDDEDADDSMEITVERPPVRQKPTPPAPVKPAGKTSSSNNLQTVNERLSAYRSASAAAKAKGETSKVRRYERAITSMNEMVKDLKAGKRVNMEELPPEVFVPSGGGGGGGGASGSGSLASKGKPQPEKVDDDEFAELAEWAGISTDKGKAEVAAPKATPSADISLISERLKMYQEGLKAAETAGDSSKIRRYKRSVETLTSLQKDAKSGRHVDMETIPPVINVPVSQTTPTSSKPVSKTTPTQPGNLIDLDDPEFDEFNLSEEDMAAMMASLPEQNKPVTTPTRALPIQATPPKVQSVPMKPKPQAPPAPAPKPQTMPTSSRPPGLIDLDTPEFTEFDLSEEDMELLASQLDMSKNVQKTPPAATPAAMPPVTTPPRETTQSLPTKMIRPVGMGGPITKEQVLLVLRERKDQYMTAVRSAKAKGDASGTKQYGSVAIQFDKAIKSIEQGQPIDLSGTPPPPPGFTSNYNYDISKYKTAAPTPAPAAVGTAPQSAQGGGGEGESDPGIPVPKTPLEGLQQRLDKYKEGLKSASDKGESSRVRRLGRIIKQYEEAIRDTKAGKFVNFEELPAPPGYPPIPSAPRAQSRPAQSLPPSRVSQPSGDGGRVKLSVNEGQIRALKQRGAEFQRAAREAKAKGDKEKALGYLRYYKGIEPMIAAAESGYPVDMTQVPPSPYSDPSKATASKGVLSHLEKAKEGDEDTFDLIEKQLEEQKDICSENAKVYEKLGNLGAASQYKNMADTCQRDLLAIKGIRKQGLTAPKFTMEMRKFAIVHSNPGLSDKLVEVEVVRGITIPCPSGVSSEQDLNIYVELEFPWPSDSVQKAETDKVKGTSNPEFNSKHQFDIDRKQMRSLQRIFKRQPLRCSLYQSRSLFRSSVFIGMASIPLETLENKCEVRASEDLKDEKGRRATGGKLEVYVRLREPLSGCDQEEKEQKWLVFQEAIASEPTVSMVRPTVSTGPASSPIKVEQTTSLDALKLEFSLVQNAIKAGKKDPAIVQRGRALQSKIQETKQRLQSDTGFRREYLSTIAREIKTEKVYEQQLVQAGRTGEAKIIQGRRRVMENEISKMTKK